MQIDYQTLYNDSYPGHTPGAKSFTDDLPEVVHQLTQKLGCLSCLDIGSGSGEMIRELRQRGVNCAGADLRQNPEYGIQHFDLSIENSSAQLQTIRSLLPYTANPRLLTCFDTLEHIGRDVMSRALWNLRELCAEWMFVSVSTRPSSKYNAFHATIIPKQTWLTMFQLLGFDVETTELTDPLHQRMEYPEHPDLWCMHQWRALDPYRDNLESESHYVVLKKRAESQVTFEEFDASVRRILGVPSLPALNIPADLHVSFLLGHYQEFLIYEPFLNSLPAQQTRVLLRSGGLDAIEHHRQQSIKAHLTSRGIRYEEVCGPDDLDWDSPAEKQALITAIDSTANRSHMLNSAIVLDARKNGIPTFQLQHGVWPHAEFDQPNTLFADYVLTWSEDFDRGFQLDCEPRSQEKQRTQFADVGCARFDQYQEAETTTMAELFGEWASSYAKSVVVASNLHWPMHTLGSKVLPQLAQTAKEQPHVLFVCKLHPVHDYDPTAMGEMPSNVVVIDEFSSLYANLTTQRLVRACDAVVCTQSTVAIEAALAKKPCTVLDTGNSNRYEGTEYTSIDSLSSTVERLLNTQDCTGEKQALLNTYYCVDQQTPALERTMDFIASHASTQPTISAADYAMTKLANTLLQDAAFKYEAEAEVIRLRMEAESLRDVTTPAITPDASVSSAESTTPASATNAATVTADDSDLPIENKSLIETIANRDQLPELLNDMGLHGLGVELGVAAGDYSKTILDHSQLRVLFSIDRWSDHHNDQECEYAVQQLSVHGTRSSILRMTFEEAIQIFTDNTFDFIYFDGYAHTGQGGIETLEAWWPKLRAGGIFAGHDYDPAWPQTMEVVDKFIAHHNLALHLTKEDPNQVEHAYPTWFVIKPETT